MGKSKRKFIEKKNASTYHLLHRSQRDVGGGDEDGGMILWPSPHNSKQTDAKVLSTSTITSMGVIQEQMAQAGLVDDYDYEQHLKPMTGSGVHVGGAFMMEDARSRPLVEDIKEVSRKLDSIALTADCMDDDVAQALFGDFDEGGFEEILDDFCLTAAQEPEESEQEEFDYDAHIRSLMERAAKQERDRNEAVSLDKHSWGRQDHDFFSKAKPLHYEGDDESYEEDGTPGVVPALNEEEERALCEKFQQTLAEYDSDEVGDLDNECEEIGGDRPLEGDAQVSAALQEFLEDKHDEIFMEGHVTEQKRSGGSGYAVLRGTRMVPASTLNALDEEQQEVVEPVQEVLQEAKQVLANPEMEPPPEEILIDGKSYFSERTRNPWDCESILSTYSNLDNNPVTIDSKRRTKKKKQPKLSSFEVQDDQVPQIRLSNKTGLPMGVLPSRQTVGDDATFVSVNKGEARKRNESAEEKKARKLAIKKEREMARIQKKMTKEAFKEEFMRRSSADVMVDGGKSVFRYS